MFIKSIVIEHLKQLEEIKINFMRNFLFWETTQADFFTSSCFARLKRVEFINFFCEKNIYYV